MIECDKGIEKVSEVALQLATEIQSPVEIISQQSTVYSFRPLCTGVSSMSDLASYPTYYPPRHPPEIRTYSLRIPADRRQAHIRSKQKRRDSIRSGFTLLEHRLASEILRRIVDKCSMHKLASNIGSENLGGRNRVTQSVLIERGSESSERSR